MAFRWPGEQIAGNKIKLVSLSWPIQARAVCLAAGLLLAIFAWPWSAGAQARSALLLGKNVSGLFERVRGQTADLAWSLNVDSSVQTPDLAQARTAGESARVAVVIWFDVLSKNALTVNAVEVATGKLFQRRVEPAQKGAALSASATAEAAALVVRSLLVALEEDADARVEQPVAKKVGSVSATAVPKTSNVVQKSPVQANTSTTSAAKKPVAPLPQVKENDSPEEAKNQPVTTPDESLVEKAPPEEFLDKGRPDLHGEYGTIATSAWQFVLGWQIAIDGASPVGQQGPSLRIGFGIGRTQLALSGFFTLPADIQKEELTVRLRRYGAMASGGYEWVADPGLRFVTSLAVGMLLFTRSPKDYASDLNPTDASPKALILQGDARLQWFPAFAHRVLGLEFTLALAVIPAAPVLSVRELNNKVTNQTKLWVVEPIGGIALVLHTG